MHILVQLEQGLGTNTLRFMSTLDDWFAFHDKSHALDNGEMA